MIIKWSKSAILDLQEIYDFIYLKNPYAADSIQKSIFQSARKLRQFPGVGRPAQRAEHRLLIETRYGYIIVYRVLDREIEIASVYDGRMDRPKDIQ